MKSGNAISLCAVVIAGSLVLWSSHAASQDAAPADIDDSIRALLVERRDTLTEIVEHLNARVVLGKASFSEVIDAQNELLSAELQLADAKDKRLEILQQRVENFRSLEEALKQQYALGDAPLDEMLAAKAARLQVTIDLLREQRRDRTAK